MSEVSIDVERDDRGRCAWHGTGDDAVSVGGVVASRTADFERFGPAGAYGYRWTDATGVPDAPFVAWVEFSAPVEG